ncbi:hypothetical protein [Azospirillum argentinense]
MQPEGAAQPGQEACSGKATYPISPGPLRAYTGAVAVPLCPARPGSPIL